MKKEIADKWIAALRSGEYKQIKGRLRTDEGFCCLGVLCNIHAQEHPEIAARQLRTSVYLRETTLLPRGVMKWAGVSLDNNECLLSAGDFTRHALTYLNDKAGFSFEKIAEVIEKNYEEL